MKSKRIYIAFLLLFVSICIRSQRPFSNDLYLITQTFTDDTNSNIFTDHTYCFDSLSFRVSSKKNLIVNRLFYQSLFDLKGEGYQVKIDPFLNLAYGSDLSAKSSIYNNKRGVFIRGKLFDKLEVFSSIIEGPSKYDQYVFAYAKSRKVDPGNAAGKFGNDYIGSINSVSYLNYKVNKFLTFEFGHGKKIIGDGYRSLVLSDNASAYPYAEMVLNFDVITYKALVSEHLILDPSVVKDGLRRKKYAVNHELKVKLWDKLNISLIESVYWAGDTTGRSSIDWTYLNPFILMRSAEFNLGSPDNMLMGGNVNFSLTPRIGLYAQAYLDEFYTKEFFAGRNWWANKYAYQFGTKLKPIKNSFLQIEYNSIRPFMYSHNQVGNSVTHLGQELAHPSGANINELNVMGTYRFKRFNCSFLLSLKKGGKDEVDSISDGANIFKSYDLRTRDYDYIIGSGSNFQQLFTQVTFSYCINHKSLLFVECVYNNRVNKIRNSSTRNNNFWFGLKTYLFNNYLDF